MERKHFVIDQWYILPWKGNLNKKIINNLVNWNILVTKGKKNQ